jgi:hypothetical protein
MFSSLYVPKPKGGIFVPLFNVKYSNFEEDIKNNIKYFLN